METIKINKLEIENVKRIKAVRMEPTASGLTIVGGNNNQGKTTVLDAIAWGLGGERYRPTEAGRRGSVVPPHLHIVMNNGLVVERRGKNGDLKVTDPEGRKGGQQLLNEFVEQLAIDLPKFMEASSSDKAKTLLQVIGVGDRLSELEQEEKELYSRRHAIGQIADQKEKYAKEQPWHTDAPKDLVSPSDLIREQQDILARNGENQRKRNDAANLAVHMQRIVDERTALERQIEELILKLKAKNQEIETAQKDLETANKSIEDLHDESTAELERSISNIEEINRKVRANMDKDKAEDDARDYRNQYDQLSAQLQEIRKNRMDLLQSAKLPLPGLSVEEGELTYNGFKWDGMSGSDRLKVATAIVRSINPKCGFVLLDKLEQMDIDTLNEFGEWLEQEGLQAIATRVSTGEECSIIISDGYVLGQEEPPEHREWKEGEF